MPRKRTTKVQVTDSFFAPAERADQQALTHSRQQLLLDELLPSVLEALPLQAMVLNQQRQVLAANRRLIDALQIGEEAVVGMRPGELIGCLFAASGPNGCGTDTHCAVCGAVNAILECQERRVPVSRETRILTAKTALDLEVTATPADLAGMPVVLCVLRDISAEKRRQVLEKIFFHDVLNTAGGIRGVASLLNSMILEPERDHEYRQWLVQLSDRLVEEVTSQRKLLAAEQGLFRPTLGIVPVAELLEELRTLYSGHEVADGRLLTVAGAPSCNLVSDGAILRRILGNLVKNALEAAEPGETVTMAARVARDTVTFSVHNPGVMPERVQLQLFQRSFSTKGEHGRGIGTYSVKLFAERYLQGTVSFVSNEDAGTTFFVTLPKVLTVVT